MVCAPSRRERLGDNKRRGAAAAHVEFLKRRDNERAAVAERNKWDSCPACILTDRYVLFLGIGTKDLINRIAGHRHGDIFAMIRGLQRRDVPGWCLLRPQSKGVLDTRAVGDDL